MLRSKDDDFIKQNIKPLYRPRHTNVNGSICYKPVLASRKAVKRHLVWFHKEHKIFFLISCWMFMRETQMS